MKKLFFLLLILSLAAGCASDNKKPSEDSRLATGAVDHIHSVKQAYEAKDRVAIEQLVPELAEGILKELDFDTAELSFTNRLIRITGTSVVVNMNWRGSWLLDQGRQIKNRGATDFILDRDTLTLNRIDGDNPFTIPAAIK